MADVENKDVSDSLGDATHKEGTDYIKDKLAGNSAGETPAAEGTTTVATTAIEPLAPVTGTEATTKPEAITPAQPPASNPGSPDATGGIAKDAGGVSSAAYVQSPTTTKEKRKSIVGQLTGFLGLGGKKDKEAKNAGAGQQDNSAAAYASGAAATTAGTTAVLADRTKTTVQENTGIDMGAKGKETADTGAAATTTTTEETPVKATEDTPAKDAEESKEPIDTSGEETHKPPKPADPKTMENKDAIPVAGGEKLGEKHWGESKVVPEVPKKPEEEGTGIASKDGQPSKEVSDNTAKNTGGATGGPSDTKTAEGGEKKEKFMDKIKGKFSKKDKS